MERSRTYLVNLVLFSDIKLETNSKLGCFSGTGHKKFIKLFPVFNINFIMFQPKDWRELEFDFMHNCVELPRDANTGIKDKEGKPGFIRFLYDPLHSKYFAGRTLKNNLRGWLPDEHPITKYINPMIMKNDMNQLFLHSDHNFVSDAEAFFSVLLAKPISVTPLETAKTETTVELKCDLKDKTDGSIIVHFGLDQVPSIRLHFWPKQAAAWIQRSRCWPPQNDIQRIVDDGCQVVPRSSPGGDSNSEWRLSFSIPEVSLAKLRSKEERWAYYVFKIIFYHHLKAIESAETEKKPLCSYVMKTTMLWACEKYPPTDHVWKSLEASAQMLLERLVDGLLKGIISHFFLPEMNLLDRVGSDVILLCIDKIINLQDNLTMAVLPTDLDERLDVIRLLDSRCKLWKKIAPCLLEKHCRFHEKMPTVKVKILAAMSTTNFGIRLT